MILDPHVHLRDGNQADKETIYHAFSLAARLGIAGLIEMPNTSPPLTTRQTVEQRLQLAEQAAHKLQGEGGKPPHYAMHVGVTRQASQIRQAVQLQQEFFPYLAGLKLYAGHSTGQMGIVKNSAQYQVYTTIAQESYTGVLVVHCEAEEHIDNSRFDPDKPCSHSLARPIVAELRSIEQQVELAEAVGFQGHLHIAHISTPEGVELVEQARRNGRRISCGVTPHHCLLSLKTQAGLGKLGNLLKVNPPLREEDRRSQLWQLLCQGKIDWIESDHAPHTLREKTGTSIASGIPGLSGMNLLYALLQKSGLGNSGLPAAQLATLRYGRALEVYRLPWPEANFATAQPPAVDIASLREAGGAPLYRGTDPYPIVVSSYAKD